MYLPIVSGKRKSIPTIELRQPKRSLWFFENDLIVNIISEIFYFSIFEFMNDFLSVPFPRK